MKPELREGAIELMNRMARDYMDAEYRSCGCVPNNDGHWLSRVERIKKGMLLALNNLPQLLKPREVPVINGKKVAIIEVEE